LLLQRVTVLCRGAPPAYLDKIVRSRGAGDSLHQLEPQLTYLGDRHDDLA
jgi:hypothetical protein